MAAYTYDYPGSLPFPLPFSFPTLAPRRRVPSIVLSPPTPERPVISTSRSTNQRLTASLFQTSSTYSLEPSSPRPRASRPGHSRSSTEPAVPPKWAYTPYARKRSAESSWNEKENEKPLYRQELSRPRQRTSTFPQAAKSVDGGAMQFTGQASTHLSKVSVNGSKTIFTQTVSALTSMFSDEYDSDAEELKEEEGTPLLPRVGPTSREHKRNGNAVPVESIDSVQPIFVIGDLDEDDEDWAWR